MKTMAISEFKAHALQVLNDVAESREIVLITKRGKPLAQIVPHRKPDTNLRAGQLSDAFVFVKDIVTPLGEGLWEACQ